MPSTAGYDVFISYSRRQDGWLAPALQAGLERFAKPWYRMRALRVFRDTASLAASPELWGTIEAALRDSRWLILFASPEAAQSSWVDREVAWWLANKSADRLLLVATSARLLWDKEAGDWAEDTPVPPSLRGASRAEPLWVDLTGVRPAGRRIRVPDEDLATVAAPLRGVDRDTLIGEHLRQHRRTMRVVRSVIATLTALLVSTVAATVVAVGQRDAARTQARIATARELAAVSGSLLGTHLDVAQLLAVAAYQTDRDPQTEGALMQAAAASPHLVRYLQAGATITALAGSSDGKTVVAGTANGELAWFDLATGRRVAVHATSSAITSLSVSANGHEVAASDATQAVAWTPGAPRASRIGGVRSPGSIAISPSGRLIAVLETTGTQAARLVVRSADGSERRVSVSSSNTYDMAGFPSESSLVLFKNSGPWRRLNVASLQTTAASEDSEVPANGFTVGAAQDGSYAGDVWYGQVKVWRMSGAMSSPSAHLRGSAPDSPARSFAISADGRKAAVAEGDGTIFVIPLTTGPASVSSPVQLTGNGDTDLMTFLGAGGRLAAAAGATIALWDPGQVSRLSAPPGVPVPFVSHAGAPPALLSPPHGRWLALVEEVAGAWLITDGHRRQAAEQRQWPQPWELPIRRGDTPLLIGMTADSDTGYYTGLVLATAAGHVFRSWPAPSGTPVAAGMLPSGNQFAVVGSDGSVRLYDISSRKVRQLAGSAGPNVEVFPQEAAVSPDGSAAILSEWWTGDSPPVARRVRYVDLRTGAAHDVGSPYAGGVLFTRHSLVIQRAAGTVQIWDPTGRRLLRTLPGTRGDTSALAVSPDGTLLARLRDDGTASLTDLATGGVLATFSLPLPGDSSSENPWGQTAMLFTSDGRYLLTATSGGQLIWWSVAPPDLVRNICATVGYTLTAAQWRQYTGTNPPSTMPCTSLGDAPRAGRCHASARGKSARLTREEGESLARPGDQVTERARLSRRLRVEPVLSVACGCR